jgi:hypothetical protein
LELRAFFYHFFPVVDQETLREQVFSLTYCMEGMDYSAIQEMDPDERNWFVGRLNKQLKRENEEIKKASAKNKGRGSSKVGRRR